MTTVRLETDIEIKLDELASLENKSKSEVIKNALLEYIEKHLSSQTPYELGKTLFGRNGSSQKVNSEEYKAKLKEKISEKYHR
jgi:RHH-type transcriptional regulator, rel operon repressor / antitoxin RelB